MNIAPGVAFTTPNVETRPVRAVVIGCGSMARHHIKHGLLASTETQIAVVCEPSPASYEWVVKLFEERGEEAPPNEPDLAKLLTQYAGQLDAAFIVTPHAFHHHQTKLCLEAGLDVLLEKPMVMSATEAEDLIETRDRTGKALVVAFNGSLSPQLRAVVGVLRSGELGPILSISATVWQNWSEITDGTWRQMPALSGGGFLFDTGAHMLNTVADLAGEDFVEVAAWLSNRGQPVETLGVVIARLASGALVTLHGCGETIPSCTSDVLVFCTEGIIRTGVWGREVGIQRRDESSFTPLDAPPAPKSVWEQFLAVRGGRIVNPSPPEVGLRMARLWDAIQASAAQGGAPVKCG
ncbi:MAG TPA: Gfo/Idh/MocA family oxidoreductase [Ardenticatenaceae bacterium]|jgi:predicted dehydrogenase